MKLLDKVEEYICTVCLAIMTILVFVNVISRYVLHMSLSFSDEITTNLFILLSMMGSAIATKRRAHLGLTAVTDALPPNLRKGLTVLGFAIGTIFSATLFYYGIHMILNQVKLGQVTPTMQWPEWVFGTFIPLGAFFLTIRFAQATIEEAKRPIHLPQEKEEIPS
ncbi:MAG: TRAP transporter small permease [Peptoniphilaceae bacterium]|nr:TRAP transporter small permease [Peptoniphilaceae bacterium]